MSASIARSVSHVDLEPEPVPRAVTEQPRGRVEHVAAGHGPRRGGRAAGHGGEVVRDALQLAAGDPAVLPRAAEEAEAVPARRLVLGRVEVVEQAGRLLDRGEDRGERVADLVGDARRHRAQRGQALLGEQARARGLQVGDRPAQVGRLLGHGRLEAHGDGLGALALQRLLAREGRDVAHEDGDDHEEGELRQDVEREQRLDGAAPQRDRGVDDGHEGRVEQRRAEPLDHGGHQHEREVGDDELGDAAAARQDEDADGARRRRGRSRAGPAGSRRARGARSGRRGWSPRRGRRSARTGAAGSAARPPRASRGPRGRAGAGR